MPVETPVPPDGTPQDQPMNVVTEENQAAPSPDVPNADASASSNADDPPKPSRRRRSAERKISALQRQLAEERSKGEATAATLLALQTEVATMKVPAPAAVAKPKLGDFKTADEFGQAWTAWEASQKPADPPAPAPTPKPADPAPARQPDPEIAAFEAEAVKIYGEEFSEVFHDDTLPLSPAMGEYLLDSDKGADLVMWLDEHRDEGKDLFHLRPKKLAEALDKIVGELEPTPPPAPVVERNADGRYTKREDPTPPPPPPGDPVRGVGTSVANEIREGMPMDDYAATRRRQMQANRVR